jgi:uncharacterized membrane protein
MIIFMINRLLTQQLITNGIIASLYVVLTITPPLNALAYLGVQFRISEVLLLLVFFRKDYIVGIVVGTFIANVFGPLGSFVWFDAILGSLVTFLSGYLLGRSRVYWIGMIPPVVFNALYLAIFLPLALALPFEWSVISSIGFSVALGQVAVLYGLGFPLYVIVRKNKYFLRLMGATQNVR